MPADAGETGADRSLENRSTAGCDYHCAVPAGKPEGFVMVDYRSAAAGSNL